MRQKLPALLLALALVLSLSAPALAAETAAVIRLTKTTGTVEISKSSGKSVSLLKNMRLYNGYHVSTEEESYAWINLDDSKLLKEDAESEVEVRKDGKSLEVLTVSGNVFFDVAKPLEDNESMNIRTSTMAVASGAPAAGLRSWTAGPPASPCWRAWWNAPWRTRSPGSSKARKSMAAKLRCASFTPRRRPATRVPSSGRSSPWTISPALS